MVAGKVKKYLKNIAKTHSQTETRKIIRNLVEHPDLTDLEKWLIYYAYGEGRMVINTCRKLGLQEAQYYITQNLALTKLYYLLHL